MPTLIIFAKSVKHGGFCVAGKCVDTGQWIRPVSDENGGAIIENQAVATNPNWLQQGKNPYPIRLLHRITMNFIRHVPLLHQQENWLNDFNTVWQHNYSISINELNAYLDRPNDLWGNNDRITNIMIENVRNSLYLIYVTNLYLYINQFNRHRARFFYNNINYDFAVTDPNFSNLINNQNNYQSAILCVSLGECYENNHYKLVASIFIGVDL